MQKSTSFVKLDPHSLKRTADRSDLPFETTADLEPYDDVLGQVRALAALDFGVAMQRDGYNIFVMGETGTGRLSLTKGYLEKTARERPTPCAYAYVENLADPRAPLAVELPPAMGKTFIDDMEMLVDSLMATFPAVFESPTYQQKKTAIDREFSQLYSSAIDQVEQKALTMGVSLFRDSENISFSPIENGKVLDETQFAQLSQEEREAFHKHVAELEDYLADRLLELPQWKREITERIRALNDDTIGKAIEPLLNKLNRKYQSHEGVRAYLSQVKADLLKTAIELLADNGAQEPRKSTAKRTRLQNKYVPNLLIDHVAEAGAPVIYENHPNYQNLFGRIEYASEQGNLVAGYKHIAAGALHRANGGYLILEAEKLLGAPNVWEALKRALKSRQIEIETPGSEQGGSSAIILKPQVIPLDVKIVLIGAREIYYLLQALDSEFNEMFRILADFDSHVERTRDNCLLFARILKARAETDGFKPLTAAGVAELIDYSSRQTENQKQLSARIGSIFEILGEAELLRGRSGDLLIDASHIKGAVGAREARSGRICEEMLREILDGIVLIDTDGSAAGKINALTVLEVGDTSFGAPARITATVYPGESGIVDIEREVELGQAIHSKGVMILTGYLGNRYAQKFPLAISAHIALEQSYGYIDGDSAALAEVCAMISALTRTPLSQSFAVTGSINQYGEVQAVGGVNEKIEGFFRLCRARGLTGKQGVIVPKSNLDNLMLKEEVIEAVAQDHFAIYAVESVDDALTILTGVDSGKMDRSGNFPKDSINFKVVARLKEISQMAGEHK